jgi:hypothetical protein
MDAIVPGRTWLDAGRGSERASSKPRRGQCGRLGWQREHDAACNEVTLEYHMGQRGRRLRFTLGDQRFVSAAVVTLAVHVLGDVFRRSVDAPQSTQAALESGWRKPR